jgi:hypothetical protein
LSALALKELNLGVTDLIKFCLMGSGVSTAAAAAARIPSDIIISDSYLKCCLEARVQVLTTRKFFFFSMFTVLTKEPGATSVE